jgi:hypothetical protein
MSLARPARPRCSTGRGITHFADNGLLNAVAVAGGMAMILYGIAVGRSRAVGAWSGVLAAAFGAWLACCTSPAT